MITDRQKKILNVIIEEYINSAEPVSSQILAHKFGFDLCSATMRIEMKNLTDLGFLEKPYISSGRIPTDKAYRIFVDSF
ncbi:MAG: heat-inducible transcription repressor HrcA, partial [Candidatus Pacebacteria bacterium]|nr:heat-inducible transcription repressor HrcA [Candidatus Paceibacterota bacterium]